MTKVTIYKNDMNECVGFRAYGHAGYAEEGQDVVCAAISVLTINTMNSIEAFTEEEFLEHTCMKAGISADSWMDESCDVYKFQGQIFR